MTPAALAQLHRAAFTSERPWSESEFAALCARDHTRLTVAGHGFALWRAIAGEAELLTIAVDPAHQRRGTGHRLMQDWMPLAAKEAETAFLEVATDNTAASTLYARHGFDVVATRPGYYQRPQGKADALIMRAPLSRLYPPVRP